MRLPQGVLVMSQADGWTGVMTGPMRGLPIVRCRIHGGWWTQAYPCPACGLLSRVSALEAQLAAAKSEQDRRCAECRQQPAEPTR